MSLSPSLTKLAAFGLDCSICALRSTISRSMVVVSFGPAGPVEGIRDGWFSGIESRPLIGKDSAVAGADLAAAQKARVAKSTAKVTIERSDFIGWSILGKGTERYAPCPRHLRGHGDCR